MSDDDMVQQRLVRSAAGHWTLIVTHCHHVSRQHDHTHQTGSEPLLLGTNETEEQSLYPRRTEQLLKFVKENCLIR